MKGPKEDFQLFARDQGIGSGKLDAYSKHLFRASTNYTVLDESLKHVHETSIFARLAMDRVIFYGTEVDSDASNIINAQMLYLDNMDSKPIHMYINSPGGECYSGLATYDVMQMLNCDVYTIVTGLAASMGFIITVGGTKGHRYALPHSRLMQHQPSGGTYGDAKSTKVWLKEMVILEKDLYQIIADHTGQPLRKVAKDCDRDYWMKPDEAKAYGAIDHIFTNKAKEALKTNKQ